MDDTTTSESENENSNETEPGEFAEEAEKQNRYKSTVWEHFLIANKEKRLGRCKLCYKKLSYRTSITNLKKHLANAHKVFCDPGLNSSYPKSEMINKLEASEEEGEVQTIEEITYLEEENLEEEVSFDKRKILRNGAWEYFEVTDEAQKVATCTLCCEELSYRTTSTNLSKHLQRRHFIEFEKVTLDEDGNPEAKNDSDDKNDRATEKKRSNVSAAWEYFTVTDASRRVATCKLCAVKCSYTSVSNLMKHVRRKHIGNEDVDQLCDDEMGESNDRATEKKRSNVSAAWEYFTVTDASRRVATCKLCAAQCCYTWVSNLMKHVRRKHIGNEDVDQLCDDEMGESNDTASEKKRSKVSAAWEYFTVTDASRRVATCKLCSAQCSFYTSVSNLMKHVRRKHVDTEDDDQLYDDEMDESKQELLKPHQSSVWLYFKCIDKEAKVAMCLICKKRLSYLSSITNLKRHLMRKHPGVKLTGSKDGKKMIISSDGQLYEIEESTKLEQTDDEDDNDQNEPLEINTIYVDDFTGTVTDNQRKRKPAKSRKRSIDIHSSSEDEVTFQRKYARKKEDSLDQFGKYIVSLLKQLPKELSNQLQADFVKQVMASQLSFESQKVGVGPSNGYAITITESRPEEAYVEGVAEDVIKTV